MIHAVKTCCNWSCLHKNCSVLISTPHLRHTSQKMSCICPLRLLLLLTCTDRSCSLPNSRTKHSHQQSILSAYQFSMLTATECCVQLLTILRLKFMPERSSPAVYFHLTYQKGIKSNETFKYTKRYQCIRCPRGDLRTPFIWHCCMHTDTVPSMPA